MVDCSQFLDEYSEYRDGLLTTGRMLAFQAHLASCASCARYDRVVEQGARVFRELPQLEPSCDFMPRLQHRLYHVDEELRAPAQQSSGVPFGLALAIAALIGATAWAPTLRPRPPVVALPPVMAHAPHRVEVVEVLFRPGPLLSPLPAEPQGGPPAANLLFYRYSPVGSYVARTASSSLPR